MEETNTHRIFLCLIVCGVLVFNPLSLVHGHFSSLNLVPPSGSGSLVVWEDQFLNDSRIAAELSEGYVVDDSAGRVYMSHTYPSWVDANFTRMKEITLTNMGNETVEPYVVDLSLSFDTDMQSDFGDIRFRDEQGTLLSYWIREKRNRSYAEVLVEYPCLPANSTEKMYLFYGNAAAESQSDFSSVFDWKERTRPDTMISFKGEAEGAWDPNVCFGSNRFLTTWEERLGPEDVELPLPDWERTRYCCIHGRTYNSTGEDPDPDENNDIDISLPPPDYSYHAENPYSAFGGGHFFVVWEQNPADSVAPANRYEADIKGALVTLAGEVTRRFDICTVSKGQYKPRVAFDEHSQRFLVVWEDGRKGYDDFEVYGRIYNSNGFPVASDFAVTDKAAYQGNAWVCADNQGSFAVVYESGPDSKLGPFSLYVQRRDSSGVQQGVTKQVADASDTQDHIFPAITFNEHSQRYLIVWNDADVSENPNIRESYSGSIYGQLLTQTLGTAVYNFVIQPGSHYLRADTVAYFGTLFFVSYDGGVSTSRDIYGRMISSKGEVLTGAQQLSDGSSETVDWNNLAVGPDGIFAVWEDERDQLSLYADAFGYVWQSVQHTASSQVSYNIGSEIQQVLSARIVSLVIEPEDLFSWQFFDYTATIPTQTTVFFDILDRNATTVVLEDVDKGENLSALTVDAVRLQARFSRTCCDKSPDLFSWNISYLVGTDIYPPSTSIQLDPEAPDGNNGWYLSPVTLSFSVSDPDSEQQNITTFYRVDEQETQQYIPESPPHIEGDGVNHSVEFWSSDSINEEYPHNILDGIHIDRSPPLLSIRSPPYMVQPGRMEVNVSVTEYASGSGLHHISLFLNDELVLEQSCAGEKHMTISYYFNISFGETFDVYIEAEDLAGNTGAARRDVVCSEQGIYQTGYLYLFDNPKLGPLPILENLDLGITVQYDVLYLVLLDISNNASRVQFSARQIKLGGVFEQWDQNLSDGCSVEFELPLGIYEITTSSYDTEDTLLDTSVLISQLGVLLL